jgi:hypothetical protein
MQRLGLAIRSALISSPSSSYKPNGILSCVMFYSFRRGPQKTLAAGHCHKGSLRTRAYMHFGSVPLRNRNGIGEEILDDERSTVGEPGEDLL